MMFTRKPTFCSMDANKLTYMNCPNALFSTVIEEVRKDRTTEDTRLMTQFWHFLQLKIVSLNLSGIPLMTQF